MTTSASKRTSSVKRRPVPYHWFQGASVVELVRQLTAAGPETARLEVRTVGNKMTFRVVAANPSVEAEKTAASDINDSFLCPPRCP